MIKETYLFRETSVLLIFQRENKYIMDFVSNNFMVLIK